MMRWLLGGALYLWLVSNGYVRAFFESPLVSLLSFGLFVCLFEAGSNVYDAVVYGRKLPDPEIERQACWEARRRRREERAPGRRKVYLFIARLCFTVAAMLAVGGVIVFFTRR